MTQEKLLQKLEDSLTYTVTVYNQSTYLLNLDNFSNNFILEYKHTTIPYDSILYFIPAVSSSGASTLTIRVPYTESANSNEIKYKDTKFEIIVETNDGKTREVKANDIIAYRMCIFRFRKGTNKVILCNSPLYDDALYSTIKATNATFVNKPELVNSENVNEKITFVTSDELALLTARVKALEEKFIIGTEDETEALSNKPAGTIYIKYEED